MPHLRLQCPEEWLHPEFTAATGFDAKKLLDHLVQVVSGLRMPNAAIDARRKALQASGVEVTEENCRIDAAGKPIPDVVPLINLINLKHAIQPLYYAHTAGDPNKRFLHVTLAAGNDTPGRTAAVRSHAAETIGMEIDKFIGDLPGVASVTVWVQDIDRDRGYTTTAERKKKREQAK
jgi:hypothetical protein